MDSRGRFFISDDFTHLISIFDSSREFQSRWGNHGSGPGELNGPSGLAFDGDDNLYVVDHLNHRVQKFTAEGAFLLTFGSEGSGDGQLNLPWGVTVAPNGDVYVADWRNDRVQRFSPDGRFVAAYGTSGRGDGELRRPAGVAVDGDGYIYVADWGNERVQVLDPDGGFVVGLRGESDLSKWAQEFMAANAEGGGGEVAFRPRKGDRAPRGRPSRGVVPHREAVLGPRFGQAGQCGQAVRDGDEPPQSAGLRAGCVARVPTGGEGLFGRAIFVPLTSGTGMLQA